MMGRIVKKNQKKIQEKIMMNRKKLGRTNIETNSILQKQDQQDDILEVLAYEKRLHQQQQDQNAVVLLKFPDIELNKTIVKGYSPEIESVEFEMPCTKRYCLVKLKKTTNVDKFCKEITEIPFSMSNDNNRITVERCKSVNQTNLYTTPIVDNSDIDPKALQILNLPKTVSVCNLKRYFSNSCRITIEHDEQNDSCYGLIYFRTVKEAIEMFKMSSDLTIDSHKLDIKFKRRKNHIDNHNLSLSLALEQNQKNENNITISSCAPIEAVRNEKDQIEENNDNSSSNLIGIESIINNKKCEEKDIKENVLNESRVLMENLEENICDTGSNSADEPVDRIELKEEEILSDYDETSNDEKLCALTDSTTTTTPAIQTENRIKTEVEKELPKHTEVIDENSNNAVLDNDKNDGINEEEILSDYEETSNDVKLCTLTDSTTITTATPVIQIQNHIKAEIDKELEKQTEVIDENSNNAVLANDKNDEIDEEEIEIKEEMNSTIDWDEYRQNELSTIEVKPDIIRAISVSPVSDTDNHDSSSISPTTITTTRSKAVKRNTSFILNSEIRQNPSTLTIINNEKSNNRSPSSSSSIAKRKYLYRDGLDDLFERMNQEDDDAIF